jgi:Dehydratase medium subunit
LTEPLVLALLTAAAPGSALAAGFEEEGVPLAVVVTEGSPKTLALEAARRAPLGIGIGGDHDRLVLVLAASSGRPYLEATASDARTMGHDAARIAARRPLRGSFSGEPR